MINQSFNQMGHGHNKGARPAKRPGLKYHAFSKGFIDFESRKRKFKELVEALEGGNHYIIGLQGMGGTGKTTLATQVGKQVLESKEFEKVIFVVVSNPPDVNKIRGEIARQLGLQLEEREEADRSKSLWHSIYKNERKLLIILDDVWEELNLTEIGIPSGLDHKNCYVLITTRNPRVCQAMRCQPIVCLDALGDGDAWTLFLSPARDFVKECGGLPIAIVALGSVLRNWPEDEWDVALTTLRDSRSLVDVDKGLATFYTCLKLSYDNLDDKKAQDLFLLFSIFPEDYEIPTSLITRLGIGLGIFGKVDRYSTAKSQALCVKNKLIGSSLLENVGEKECVKMHGLVREVAQCIAKEDIHVIKDSRTNLKKNRRFVFWSTDDFPDEFDDKELEFLLLWISGNVLVKDPNAFFVGISRLKFLFLLGECDRKVPSPSLPKSLLSLECIHTLILDGWELGDISIFKNIQSLVTLELKNCLIIELPRNIMELKKLRWLGMRKCEIQKNNPLEVIEKCSQLEAVYFVENFNVEDWNIEDDKEIKDEIAQDISPAELQIFSIAYDGFKRFVGDDNGLFRCFNPGHVTHLIPDAMFKYLVRSAEVLELGERGQTMWKNLAPDVIPLENGGMDNLIKLYLYEWDDIECLIDNSRYHDSNTFFSNLVELHLYRVDVKKLYWGAMPSCFLWQLQILKLEKCEKLQNIFFDENIMLPHLKALRLIRCPMFQPSIFHPSVAQSLEQLEELVIEGCEELNFLIQYESQKNYGVLFPALKSLRIKGCGKLEMVFSLLLSEDLPMLKDLYIKGCTKLEYIFGGYGVVGQVSLQEIILPLLTEVTLNDVPSLISIFQNCQKCEIRPPQVFKDDSKEKYENSKAKAFSWAYGCCFVAPNKDTNIGVPNATMEHHTISEGSCGSSKRMETLHTVECLVKHPLSLQNIREMRLMKCLKLKSLFSVSIATTIMLEKLEISNCEKLKDIITNEAEDDDLSDCTSIFPNLQSLQVASCNKLEFIFPSTLSGSLQKLKSIHIIEAHDLKYVFGKYNNESHIHLPALEALFLQDVPNMISIGVLKYQQKCPSIPIVEAAKGSCASSNEKKIETFHTTECLMRQPLSLKNIREMRLWACLKLKSLFSVSIATTMIMLEKLEITDCEELKYIISNEAEDDDHLNCTSIFPKLQILDVWYCNKLEFIFPSTLSKGLQKLKSVHINGAHELKYVFGKYNEEECVSNENENDQLQIHLPAWEALSLLNVPKMINICAKKDYLSFPSLQSINLEDLQEFNGRSFLHLMASLQGRQLNVTALKDLRKIIKDVQKLIQLRIRDSKIEEVLNLEGVEIEDTVLILSLEEMWLNDLSELNHICKGPKYFMSLRSLRQLNIIACKKLRVIFSVSIVNSLPQLSDLTIEDCNELVDIIEESVEGLLHQICFPKLKTISIDRCNSLKCLFSISTCGMFPKLWLLEIEEASELEQVFIHKQDDMQKMTMMDELFPELSDVTLRKLPMLVTICEGIDFQTLKDCEVDDCPKYQGINPIPEGPEDEDSENQAETNASPDVAESSNEAMTKSVEEVASSFSKKETVKEIEAKDPTPALLERQALEGSTTKPQLRSTSLNSIGAILKERAEEGSASEDVVAATMVADLAPRNSCDLMPSESRSKRLELAADMMIVSVASSVFSQVEGSKFGPSTLEKAKEVHEKATASNTLPMATTFEPEFVRARNKEGGVYSSVQKEAKSKKPIKEILPQVIPSLHYQSQYADVGSSSPKLGIEIFRLVELKHGETGLLAQALEQYPQLLLPRANRTHRIIAWSYRVLVDILVMLDTKTPNTITPSEKSTLEANLSEAIVLGFDKDWVESIRAKVFGVDYPKFGICEIFRLVELKHGETALLAQALEQYPQLLVPRTNRTHRIIAWSYRVLVDILVMLDTKTPNTITQSEKSTLEANLSEAIVLGFNKEWVESIRAKVFGSYMSDVSAAREEIQVMEPLGEIESKLLSLSEDWKKLIESMTMFRDIVSAKDKPFGI